MKKGLVAFHALAVWAGKEGLSSARRLAVRWGKRYVICRLAASTCEHQRRVLFRGKVGSFEILL